MQGAEKKSPQTYKGLAESIPKNPYRREGGRRVRGELRSRLLTLRNEYFLGDVTTKKQQIKDKPENNEIEVDYQPRLREEDLKKFSPFDLREGIEWHTSYLKGIFLMLDCGLSGGDLENMTNLGLVVKILMAMQDKCDLIMSMGNELHSRVRCE